MRVILVHQRRGLTRTFVIKGWLQGLLSLCLLVAPLAFGCLGYQVSVQHSDQAYTQQALSRPLNNVSEADATQVVFEQPVSASDLAAAALVDIVTALAEDHSTLPAPLPWSTEAAGSPRQVLVVGRSACSARYHCYRHGRIVDPATYQHHSLG